MHTVEILDGEVLIMTKVFKSLTAALQWADDKECDGFEAVVSSPEWNDYPRK